MLKEIATNEFKGNPFSMIGADWMLIAAENGEKANTMTAQWGGMGFMWGKDVVYAVIRPSRYTKEFVDTAGAFSLCFPPPDKYRKTMGYLGSVSGRDEDKIQKSGLTLAYADGVPYFEESDTVIIAKTLYAQEMAEGSFLDNGLIGQWYPEKDFHTLYIAEVSKILVKG
ncbi:flavin reductase [Christensenellaceae bacterium OttesenSCG-928-K19]|nr:flavin reductase [Christensenellaceae bacterium OttesenSCG-928-K19]